MAQLVEHPTLDFGSGHDLTVHGFKPCAVSAEPAWDSLPPSLSDLLSLSLPPSLKINKHFKKKKRKKENAPSITQAL